MECIYNSAYNEVCMELVTLHLKHYILVYIGKYCYLLDGEASMEDARIDKDRTELSTLK